MTDRPPSAWGRRTAGGENDARRPGRAGDASLEELREAVRARDEFIAVAAHELRNPMTPIAIRVQSLLDAARRAPGAVPPEILEGLEGLGLAIDVYLRRAATLLQVSRLTAADRPQLEPTAVDLSGLVRSAAERHRSMANYVGSALETRVQDGVSGTWDQVALEQIIDNLLANALKYGAGEPVEVALAADGDAVRLTVCDRGIGISPEDQARIFERFERVMTRNPRGGFGVGLWVVRRLVEAMGGRIEVESAPGAGSAFSVILPLKPGSRRE